MNQSEERLWRIFNTINGWLRHADLKNTYMLTFTLVVISVMKITPNQFKTIIESEISFPVLFACLFCSALSFIISAYSFLPYKRNGYPKILCECLSKKIFSLENSQKTDGLLLQHDDIAMLNVGIFQYRIGQLASSDGDDRTKKSLCLLRNMILINGRIWHIKFKLFTFSFYSLITGCIIFFLGLFF